MIGAKMMYITHEAFKSTIEAYKEHALGNLGDNKENGLNRNIKPYRSMSADEWLKETLEKQKIFS
jgi:hypothetical protein